ncbi:MAG TPA: SRPBCC domain-containing protein [Polyangiaceae bacterium]|nr:SRPBCC domain-containing protein [Polyangiaceae bacterium]
MRFERTYPFSREALWLALTDRRALEQRWLEADFEPLAGRRFVLRDLARGPFGGLVRGEVLEAVRPLRLRHSWSVGGRPPSSVTWELHEIEGGTRIVLEHRGFRGTGGRLWALVHCLTWRRYLAGELPEAAELFDRRGPDAAFPKPPRHVRLGRLAYLL